MDDTLAMQMATLQARVEALENAAPENRVSMVVFSGDLDKALAAVAEAAARAVTWARRRCA